MSEQTREDTNTDETMSWRHYESLLQHPEKRKENIKAFISVMIFLHILFVALKETKESSNKRRADGREEDEKTNADITEYVRKNKFLLFIIMFEMILLSSFSFYVRTYT